MNDHAGRASWPRDLLEVFTPRSSCMHDEPDVVWLHFAADLLIALAYFSIPFALAYLVRRRRDLAFDRRFLLVASFIVLCGITHVSEVRALWQPLYRLDGYIKLLTGFVSAITAIFLWRLIPRALTIPAADELRRMNERLLAEVAERRRVEEELQRLNADLERRVQERTAELEAVYATAPVGLCVLDRELRWVRINRYLAEINGLPPAVHIGKTVRELLPALADQAEGLFRRVLESGEPLLGVSLEGETAARPGDRRAWVESFHPLRDDAGRVIGMNIVCEDVTERRRIERALQESELYHRSLFEASAVGFAETELPTGRFLRVNPRCCALLGYSADELLGMTLPDLVHPDDRPHTRRTIDSFIHGERDEHEVERRHVRRDGSVVWVHVVHTLLRAVSGRPARLLGVFQDITARKHAEAALRAGEQRLAMALEAGQLGFWDWDIPSGHVHFGGLWASMLGYELDELEPHKRTWERLLHPDEAERVMRILEAHLTGESEFYECEQRLRHRDGSWRWILARGRVVERDAAGRPLRALGTHTDVTARNAAQERLRESEERFRGTFENAAVGIAHVSPDGRWLDLNDRFCAILGDSREEVLARDFRSITHPDDLAADVELRDRLVRGEIDHYALEKRYIRKDGGAVWVNLTASALRGQDGELRHFIAIVEDITARRRVEDDLRYQLDLTHSITANATTAIFMMDEQGRCTFMNPAAEETTGFRFEEVRGRVLHDCIHHHRPDGSPYPASECPIDRALPQQLEVRDHEDVFMRKGGELFPVVCNARVVHKDGRGVGTVIEIRDVTEERRAAEQLRAAEERLRLAVSAAGIGYWSWDVIEDCTEQDARCAELFELPTGTSLSAVLARIHPDDRERVQAELQASCAGLRPFRAEFRVLARDGSTRWLVGLGDVVRDADGRAVRMFGVNFDNTERKQVEQSLQRRERELQTLTAALRDADRRKDEFLATLAHELRNPLAPVRTGLHLLKLAPSGEQAARARDMMERQLGHMIRLIDDLLDVSRISRGKVTLKRERVTLQDVVASALETSGPLIAAARHTLEVRLPEAPVHLFVDPMRLAQVLSNILNNAAKYTPEGGTITLSAACEPDAVTLQVTDTGVGIPAEMLPRVFEMFTQVGRTVERAQGGLGIGLSLVQHLVELHGGTVAAESPGPGRGSTFTVRIPRSRDARPQAGVAPDRAPARPAERGGRRVLVVDDNDDGAESLAMMLGLTGYEARTAHDGPSALALARSFRPELVFLDIGLPGMNGYEVARRLREDPELARITLVALTGWGSEDDKRRAREAGFDAHLTKPVESAAVEDVLARFRRPSDA